MSSPYIPPQTPMPGMGGPPPPKKSKALFMLLGLVALCAVAGAVLVIMTMGDKDTGEAEAEAAVDEGKKEVEATPTNDTPPPTNQGIGSLGLDEVPEITVSLDTVPPNAEVFRKGESVGVTPLTRRFEKGSGTETWQLFLDGYQVEEIDVEMDADFHSEVVLTKLADDAPSVARPTASNASDKSKDNDSDDKKSDKGGKNVKKNDKGTRAVIGTTGASLPD